MDFFFFNNSGHLVFLFWMRDHGAMSGRSGMVKRETPQDMRKSSSEKAARRREKVAKR